MKYVYEFVIRVSDTPFTKQIPNRTNFQSMYLFVLCHACLFNSIITAIPLVELKIFIFSANYI